MAQHATHTERIEYDHAPIPATEADLPDFGVPEAPQVTTDAVEGHETFEAPDFGGLKDR